jgi:transcriptional regulator with XRE-family HTH domain
LLYYICEYEKPNIQTWQKHQAYTRAKEMSQGDICRAVGLDRAQMSNIESGNGNPTLATIDKIAKALGVSNDELLR